MVVVNTYIPPSTSHYSPERGGGKSYGELLTEIVDAAVGLSMSAPLGRCPSLWLGDFNCHTG